MNIEEVRKAAGFPSQAAFADWLGISPRHYRKLIIAPSIPRVYELVAVLIEGRTYDDLMSLKISSS